VVEINPWVVEVGRRWFHLPLADPRLTVLAMDAARWLEELATPRSVTLLHVDLYDEEADAPVLDDEAFYAGCRRVLAPGGVMSVNLFGRRASYVESAARIAAAFGADQVWSLQPTREGNTTVVAGHAVTVPSREDLIARAERLQARFGTLGLKPRQWLHMVRPYTGTAGIAGEPSA
jgi:spermidine synthase